MVKGNMESMMWLKDFKYNNQLPFVIQQIYDFFIFRKLCKTVSDEDIYKFHTEYLTKYRSRRFTDALTVFILHLQSRLATQLRAKNTYIEKQNKESKHDIRDDLRFRQHVLETERWRGLSQIEKDKKYACYPGGLMRAPLEVFTSQPKLEEFIDDDGVGYRIYDKVYNVYTATIFSPSRRRPGRSRGVVLLKNEMLEGYGGLKSWVVLEIDKEKRRQRQSKMSVIKRESVQKMNKEPDISKVRRMMGLDSSNNSDLDGDIF